jgi:malate dehydrogenase (oxaloacetate-decarboxylating)
MKTAAARAIAEIVRPEELREDYIIPSVFNREVAVAVAEAVAEAAARTDAVAPGTGPTAPAGAPALG